MRVSLYIHIPFCRKKCLYCDFYSIDYQPDLAQDYTDVLCYQIAKIKDKVVTLYIGGGTPTVMEAGLLKKLFIAIKKRFTPREFTVEVNPESINSDKLDIFRWAGVNRISIGVQAFNQRKLVKLGRIHSVEDSINAILLAKRKGFENISIDLIFGVCGETIKEWKKELNIAVNLNLKHISLYTLTYEENTPLYRKFKAGEIIPLEDSVVVEMYNYARRYLSSYGFYQYEISNFARNRYWCRHNLSYWDNDPYIGIGPSAVSYKNGVRMENVKDVREYISRIRQGDDVVASYDNLSPLQRAKEYAALSIRTTKGILFRKFYRKTGFIFEDIMGSDLEDMVKDNFVTFIYRKGYPVGIKLTSKGIIFADTVSSAFL